MPLKVDQGARIWPPPSSQISAPSAHIAPTGVLDFQNLSFARPAYSLRLPMFRQKKKNWCWAACIQMVMAYFEVEVSQCQVAGVFFPNRNCCGNPNSCNEGCDPEDVKEILRQNPLQVRCRRQNQGLTYKSIQSEINKFRPIAAAIMWYTDNGNQRGGHLILIRGWRRLRGRSYVKVNDPWYGPGEVPYSKLRKYYGPDDDALDGVWEHTWTNIRRD